MIWKKKYHFFTAGIILLISLTLFQNYKDKNQTAGNSKSLNQQGSQRLYVTNAGSQSISIINPQTKKVIQELKDIGDEPAFLAAFPRLDKFFVGDLSRKEIQSIQISNHTNLPGIKISLPIAGIVADVKNEYFYGLELGEEENPGKSLYIFDANANVLTAQIQIGANVQDIRINPDTQTLYITDFNEGLKIIDIEKNYQIIQTLPISGKPHGIAVDMYNEGRIFVTQVEEQSVSIIDIDPESKQYKVSKTISVGREPQWVALNTNSTKAYVTNQADNTVSVIDTKKQMVINTVDVGSAPFYALFNEETDSVYITNMESNTISIIDNKDIVIDTIEVGTMPVGMALISD